MVKHELRVDSLKARVQIHEFQFTSYEFKYTGYEFRSTSYEFKSTSSRIIKSMKTQVNTLNIFPFPKILSLKLLGITRGNSYSALW